VRKKEEKNQKRDKRRLDWDERKKETNLRRK
jgi:hypothetical protein